MPPGRVRKRGKERERGEVESYKIKGEGGKKRER